MLNKVAVYGSLKRGFGNNGVLGDSKFLGKKWLQGFDMFEVCSAFPCITVGEGKIEVELFEIDKETLQRLDWLEGYRGEGDGNLYNRIEIEGHYLYVYGRIPEGLKKVEGGVWT